MKKMIGWMATGALGLTTLCGCAGFGTDTSIGNTTVNNFGGEPRSRQAAPAPAASPAPAATTSGKKVVIIGSQRDLLRVRIFAEGSDVDAKNLASGIEQALSGALSANSAKIVTGNDADLRLTIRPKLNVIDQSGEYFRISADVSVDLKDIDAKRVYAAKAIKIAGIRALGRDKTIAKLTEPASGEAVEWTQSALKNIADNEITVDRLQIQLPGKRDAQKDNVRIQQIAKNLAKLGGVVSYGFTGFDSASGIVEYRVVYFNESYPGGIANAAGALLGSATELK